MKHLARLLPQADLYRIRHPPLGHDRAKVTRKLGTGGAASCSLIEGINRDETLEITAPSSGLLALGAINLIWASVETYVSAALFSVLEIDERDFTILVGRLEIIPKLKKLEQILAHRADPRSGFVEQFIKEAIDLRPDRNAVTHGVYKGKTKSGEHVFFLMADQMLDEEVGSVRKMRVFSDQQLSEHLNQTIDLFDNIQRAFESKKIAKAIRGLIPRSNTVPLTII